MPDIIGQTIDRYQIMEQLGQGGMATVYLAFDLRLDRKVAVKVIRRDVFPPVVLDRVLKRFEREAKALAKLNHLNIVSIIDFGTYDGSPYLVMPYIPSGTLKDKLGKPIHYNQAAQILAPIARALAYAHEEEIIHRDVKPSNVLITRSGDPVLTDFGVAKLLEEVDGNTLTGTGMGLGTPEYMAPEQWQGKADARSDQYALGVIFYEMVTGQKPYTADTPIAIMLKQLNEPLPKLRQFTVDLPKEVEFSVLKMMAKDPENRYSDMNAVATMLEKVAIQQFSIRDQTGYFDIDLDQVDEQTRYDQASSQVKVQTAKAVNESNRLKSVPSSDQTIDQVGSLEAKLEPVMGKLENFGGTNISALEEKSKGSKVSKKWSLTLIGILAVGFTIITLLSSNQTKKYLPVPTETNQVAVVETSNPIDTAQLAKTSIIMITPTQVENFVPNSGIGSTKISEIDGMEMVYVPAGNFLMGNDRNDAYSHESPLHKVYLDAYWIDKYEVTNAQYRKCEQSGFCDRPNQVNSATHSSYYEDLQFDEHPVVYVSWNDAQTYCQWAGRELPTEAQWEKAARGTDGGNYPWGNEAPTSKLLNYNSNAGDTAEVGSYPAGASPNGAMDMAGNVFEWVSDWYDANYYSISPLENPQGPINGNKRVIRGGSWGSFEWDVRPSARNWIFPDGVGNVYGFRCSTLN